MFTDERKRNVLERPQIPLHLRRNLLFLNLHRNLPPITQPRPMNLRHTRTRPRPALHHPLPRLPRKAHPKHLLGTPSKVLPDHPRHILPLILRRIIKHPSKHALKLRRQDRRLHGNRLPDLQIQSTIGAQELGEALGVARVHGGDGVCEGRVGAEIELVVECDEDAEGEGAGGAGEAGGVEEAVDGVDGAEGEGEVEQASEETAGAEVGFGGGGRAEGGRRRGDEGLELGGVDRAGER